MNRLPRATADASRASKFILFRNEQTCDRKKLVAREIIEGDAEERIVVHPPGRSQQS
jgi:hypothetical protein